MIALPRRVQNRACVYSAVKTVSVLMSSWRKEPVECKEVYDEGERGVRLEFDTENQGTDFQGDTRRWLWLRC